MNAAVAQERWQGQIIGGKFPLLEWLGGSANTAVFSTQLTAPTPQMAAIKLIRAENVNAPQQIARWKESAALSHSNLLRIFDAGYCQITGAHWLYVVTELAEENLDQVLPVRPLSIPEVSELLPPILDALRFLHAKQLVHGRIKPSNVLAVNNQLKLSVDGLRPANQKSNDRLLTAYDAPEAEAGVLSDASDVWSLGMLLLTAFNQRPVTWSRSSRQDPAVPKSVPAPYSQIAAECLRIDPQQRASLGRVKEIIARSVPPANLTVLPQPAKKTASRRKFVVPGLAAVVIAGAIILGLASRHSKNPVAPPPAQKVEQTNTGTKTASTAKRPNPSRTPAAQAGAVVDRVVPQVPLSARETITGKVRVRVRVSVDANGNVKTASFVSPGPSKYFARLALEASQKWKFTPAGQSGTSSNRQWLLEYKFGRSSTEVTPVALH
ncbi:MAG TPA: TonB family protein [Terriglobales bacterium]|nr:TonB family protein [Terriglobales bacterium]